MVDSEISGVGVHPGCGDWAGINVLASGAKIENSIISNSFCGLALLGNDNVVTGNKIFFCQTAINSAGINNVFQNNTISYCQFAGIQHRANGNLVFTGNSFAHIWGIGADIHANAEIKHNKFYHTIRGLGGTDMTSLRDIVNSCGSKKRITLTFYAATFNISLFSGSPSINFSPARTNGSNLKLRNLRHRFSAS
jgi:hypothetical protein